MSELPLNRGDGDDPRRLREMLSRATDLVLDHQLSCVLVGLAGFEGDSLFPEMVRFVESALRVDDSVFRMTRERVVLLLTDVDESKARAIVARILEDFAERFPTVREPAIGLGFYEVSSDRPGATAKDVLPQLFAASPRPH